MQGLHTERKALEVDTKQHYNKYYIEYKITSSIESLIKLGLITNRKYKHSN